MANESKERTRLDNIPWRGDFPLRLIGQICANDRQSIVDELREIIGSIEMGYCSSGGGGRDISAEWRIEKNITSSEPE